MSRIPTSPQVQGADAALAHAPLAFMGDIVEVAIDRYTGSDMGCEADYNVYRMLLA